MSRPQFAVVTGGITIWLVLCLVGFWLKAHLRFVSPGYDLAWFAQTASQAWSGNGLWVTFERPISHLVQHWEPILYTAAPLTAVFRAPEAVVIWQWFGLALGTAGAFKLASLFLPIWPRFAMTILFVVSFPIFNPFQYDLHPPVFGATGLVPWTVYVLIKRRWAWGTFLLLILAQCGEVFFAVIPPYFVYMLHCKWPVFFLSKILHIRVQQLLFSFVGIAAVASGYLLIGLYQRHFGPWLTGDPFPFQDRYSKVGGDGLGMLKTLFTSPQLIFEQFWAVEKIKTFAKALLYLGPFPFFAFALKRHRGLALTLCFGTLPYFVKVGLSHDANMMTTNTHYIAEFGPQYWVLALLGTSFFYQNEEIESSFCGHLQFLKRALWHPFSAAMILLIIVYLNTSEWRVSPLRTLRQLWLAEATPRDPSLQALADSLGEDKGVAVVDAEWLCPTFAHRRKWLACNHITSKTLLQFPDLSVVVGTREGVRKAYLGLSSEERKHPHAQVLLRISENQENSAGFESFGEFEQKSKKETRSYFVWRRADNNVNR